MEQQRWRLSGICALGVLIWMLPSPPVKDPRAWPLFAIFVATIVGMIAKPLPMGGMAMVATGVILLTATLTVSEVLSGFANNTLWLLVAAFFLSVGFVKTGLGTRIAYGLVARFGRSTLGLGYSLILTDLVLAPAIASSTARAGGVLFPILQALTRLSQAENPVAGKLTSAYLTLTTYQGTVVTSAMFLTATVVNPLCVQLAASQGITITWYTWAKAGIVPGLLSLALVPMLVYRLCPPGVLHTPTAPTHAKEALRALGPMSRNEWVMGIITAALIGAWMFGSMISLDATAAALIAVAALLVTGVLAWDDLSGEREAWSLFIWFGSLVMMANYLSQFGLVGWFTDQIGAAFDGLNWVWGAAGLGLAYFYSHYLFVSNTAHVSAMFAPFLAIALALGTPPFLAAMMLGALSSIDACLTHYGTPPGPILFSSGHVPIGLWWKTGAVLSLAHLAIWFGVGSAWWSALGLW